jgi:type IX secretion system substrate protein/VCBS repeat protein
MFFKKGFILLLCGVFSSMTFAQFSRFYTEVFDGADKLDLAYVGGLIAPEFSEVDLNNDGIEDLYIFDKAGNVSLTFLNEGTPNEVDYVYAPYYERLFPVLKGWVILRDYNGDGVKDIFSFSDYPGIQGVIVFNGKYESGVIKFERLEFVNDDQNLIPFPSGNGYTQLYVTDQDYPAIDDIDGDGDLDILTFAVGGGHVEFYENQSVEMGFGQDSLIFELVDDCWGRFYESGISEEIDLSDDISICASGFHDEEDPSGTVRHVGSTLLTFDNDADGDKDLLLGDISYDNLNLLTNGGDQSMAFMTDQDIHFPSYNLSADIAIFPASFYLDVNNDGIKDLLASPNVWKPGENHEVVWRYQNNGENNQPNFQFIEKDFLVDEMIDLGKEAHPTFVDYNADGLLDLVVGNSTFYRPFGEIAARIFLFENTGTANNPKFELVDEDYLGFSIYDDTGRNTPALTFGDLDNDGDMDVIIGEQSGGFFYGENIGGAGNPINIPSLQIGYMGLDLGVRSIPQLIDLNRDGKLDILAGEKVGRLVYFQNDGTPEEPMFVPNIDFNTPGGNNIITLGLVDTRLGETTGNAAPFVYDFDGEYVLFSGSEKGNIIKYSDIDGNLGGAFTMDTDFYGEIRPGFMTVPYLVDINNDGRLEMFVGNVRGGLTAYKTNYLTDGSIVANNEIPESNTGVKLYPNPAGSFVNVEMTNADFSKGEILVYNAIGQLVYNGIVESKNSSLSTENWGKGLFVIQMKVGAETLIEKIIVQ